MASRSRFGLVFNTIADHRSGCTWRYATQWNRRQGVRTHRQGRLVLGRRCVVDESECFERADGEASECSGEVWHFGGGQQMGQGVASRGQNLRTLSASNPAGVLTEGDITNSVQIVFDRPVPPIQLQQSGRTRLPRAEAGDTVNGFLLDATIAEAACAVELEDLGDTRPIAKVFGQGRGGRQGAGFDATVSLVGSRDGVLLRLPLFPLVGGKKPNSQRTCRRCRSAAWAGCP